VSQQSFVRLLLLLVVLASAGDLQAQNGVEEPARRAAAAFLRPGDRIELQFRRDRELSGGVSVNERGEAVFPKLGTLDVTRVTIGALQDTLRQRYAEFLRAPELDVTVLRRIVVNGEVRMPNVYMVDLTTGVREAIARAGGLLETASKSKVAVIRDGQERRIKDWDRNQGPENDLQSGDQIVVGRKSWLVINALPVISTSVIVLGLIQSLRQK
jgi:protein involved in polysaccharide export with SLBB domain